MPTYDFDVFVHICGTVDTDEEIESEDDLVDFIFPDGYEGEIWGISTTPPRFSRDGYLTRTDDEEGDEE